MLFFNQKDNNEFFRSVSRIKRTFCILVSCVLCLLILSSCGKQKQYAVKYDEFKYNNVIGWDASYSDVVAQYGTPDDMELTNWRFTAIYNNISAVGQDGWTLKFFFNYETGYLTEIWLRYESSSRSYVQQLHKVVYDALESKYGEPSKSTRTDAFSLFFYDEWTEQIEDTKIDIDTESDVKIGKNLDRKGSVCNVVYNCHRDKSKRPTYNDMPLTPSPVPTDSPTPVPPSPTPTVNTNGI